MRSVRPWDLAVSACALLLIIAMAFPWYRANGEDASAFRAITYSSKLLVVIAIVCMLLPIAAVRRPTYHDIQRFAVVVLALGLIATLIVVLRLVDVPVVFAVTAKVTIRPFAWIGLILCVGIVLFSALGMRARVAHRGLRSTA
jgi:hypothetical protein